MNVICIPLLNYEVLSLTLLNLYFFNENIKVYAFMLAFFARLLYNHGVTIVSFAINILMLVTWNARVALPGAGDPPLNTTGIPPGVYE